MTWGEGATVQNGGSQGLLKDVSEHRLNDTKEPALQRLKVKKSMRKSPEAGRSLADSKNRKKPVCLGSGFGGVGASGS